MWRTVATFRDLPDAEIARGRLEAEGIDAHVHDGFVVGVNWLYSYAVQGVKVRVAEESAEAAAEILRGEWADLLEPPGPDDRPLSCQVCGSDTVASYDPLRILAALTLLPAWPLLLLFGIPWIRWSARRRCLSCRRTW